MSYKNSATFFENPYQGLITWNSWRSFFQRTWHKSAGNILVGTAVETLAPLMHRPHVWPNTVSLLATRTPSDLPKMQSDVTNSSKASGDWGTPLFRESDSFLYYQDRSKLPAVAEPLQRSLSDWPWAAHTGPRAVVGTNVAAHITTLTDRKCPFLNVVSSLRLTFCVSKESDATSACNATLSL